MSDELTDADFKHMTTPVTDADIERILAQPVVERQEQLSDYHNAFQKLHDWLEDDRDRRSVVIRSGNMTVWWVGLYIDQRCVAGTVDEGGLLEMLEEAFEGIVIQDRGGFEVAEP